MRVWRNRQVVTDVDDKRTTQTLCVTRLIEIYGHVKFESSSYLRKTLRVLHITPSLRVLRATEKEPNSFSESQWSNFICNDSAHIWWVWSAGGWRAGFSWNLHAPTNPRFPDRGKIFLSILRREEDWNLDGKEDIRVLGLPQAVEEEGKVVMVVQGLKRHLVQLWSFCFMRIVRSNLPADSVSTPIMLQCNREVAPVAKTYYYYLLFL